MAEKQAVELLAGATLKSPETTSRTRSVTIASRYTMLHVRNMR